MTLLGACSSLSSPQDRTTDSLSDDVSMDDTLLLLTPKQADSLEFRLLHHYTNNFNFMVVVDSLILTPREDELTDTVILRYHDRIVVADIRQSDTIWVKVARDQFSMGWVSEEKLMQATVPDDSISQAISWLTQTRFIWMSAVIVLGVIGFLLGWRLKHRFQIFRFNEMDSIYPTLMLILTSIMAALYASIQNFVPEFWQEFYFHPTLNPFILPPVMAALVTVVWLLIIVFIAMVVDVYHNLYFLSGITYVLEMLGVSMLSYLLISVLTLYYVGYLVLLAYIVALLWIYFRHVRCRFVCGHCGHSMRQKGICPRCGRLNQ